MTFRTYFWRLFLAYFFVMAAGVVLTGVYAAYRLHAVRYEGAKRTLLEECRLAYELVREDLKKHALPELDAKLRAMKTATGARITLIAEDGTVLADTDADAGKMDNHRLRPEIVGASSQGAGESSRASHTLSTEMFYLATQHGGPNAAPCYVRLAVPLDVMRKGLGTFDRDMALMALLTLAIGGGLCFWLAYWRAGPITQLSRFAAALAKEDLSQRVHASDTGVFGALNRALNQIADSMAATKNQAGHQQDDLLAVLRSMSDGIIATNRQQRILLVNPAAASMLEFSAAQSSGRALWESVREEMVLKAAARVLESGEASVVKLACRGRQIEVRISPLLHQDRPEGLLLVSRDRTAEIQYQEMRKEFVANVSHELRTPVTLIKGFVETLRDGALNDPVKGPQYLATVDKHIDQLTNLVNDLLELSRLEGKPGLPRRSSVRIGERIEKVIELMRPAAEKKTHRITVRVPDSLPQISGDADYIERAIANLVDNAIKYTPAGGEIELSASVTGDRVIVTVSDNGIGIPPQDQPRIFERFYRVDKSRSRDMGGTGLGLAIVKHVALVHGGNVEVQSEPGKGTVFRLILPSAP